MVFIDMIRRQLRACEENTPHAVVTIAGSDGTARTEGKMLVFEDGPSVGTIGGGAVEQLALRDAREAIHTGAGGLYAYNLNTEAAARGLACGGALRVLIEVFCARPALVMCGGGHVGRAVMPLARSVGFQTVLVDNRPAEALSDAIALADRFVPVNDFEAGLRGLDAAPGSYYVIAGPSHNCDGAALAAALDKDAAYIGMIGSARKIDAIYSMLRQKGVPQQALERVHAPIGLDIAGQRPEEIAVAIVAELLMIRNGKPRPAGL